MLEVSKKNIRLWSMLGQRGTCGYTLADLAETDESILCMTADLCTTSGLERFKNAHSDRMLNVGIAEQNMIGIAAGLAMDGYQVFTSTFATFASMRAVEQLRTMLAYMDLNVKVIGMASGFSMGLFGNTHYSMEDLAVTRSIPNLTVLSPADSTETMKLLVAATSMKGACYIRLAGTGNMPSVYSDDYALQIGKAIELREGIDVALIATGSMVYQSLKAAEQLEARGISCAVVNMHTIKPLDTDAIDALCESRKLIVTVEEHSVIGGLGGAVAEHLAKKDRHPPLEIIGIEDLFPHAGDYQYLLEQCGLSARQIANRVFMRLANHA